MTAACDALAWEPAFLRDQSRADVAQYANYPDLFDDPTKPDAQKGAIDPGWRRFCQYGDDLVAAKLRDADGTIQTVQGLGVLPHSGITRPRDWYRNRYFLVI